MRTDHGHVPSIFGLVIPTGTLASQARPGNPAGVGLAVMDAQNGRYGALDSGLPDDLVVHHAVLVG